MGKKTQSETKYALKFCFLLCLDGHKQKAQSSYVASMNQSLEMLLLIYSFYEELFYILKIDKCSLNCNIFSL